MTPWPRDLPLIEAQHHQSGEAIRLWSSVFGHDPTRSAAGLNLAGVGCSAGAGSQERYDGVKTAFDAPHARRFYLYHISSPSFLMDFLELNPVFQLTMSFWIAISFGSARGTTFPLCGSYRHLAPRGDSGSPAIAAEDGLGATSGCCWNARRRHENKQKTKDRAFQETT
jgi:hypothetical protein